ncbi:TolC family protein [Emticicia fluvialis]|uniref:TolC family protein n=1 Tax=Emticicia fluvialis TaxID=2974474 RepID=UPI0021657249|nr:TolC family protein [Emticicia fluvialis]
MALRKNSLIVFIFLVSYFFTISETRAQVTAADDALTRALATDALLPLLIDAALKNSPQIKKLNSNLKAAESTLKYNKNLIYSGITVGGNYHYGTNYSAVTDQTSYENVLNRLTMVQSGFYSVGGGISFPLSGLLNRKHLINTGKAQIESIENDKDVSALSIRQDVIALYQELKLSHKLLAISSSNKQAFQVNYNLAEKEFLQGQLSVSEVSRMLDYINKAKMEYETTLNKFQTNLFQLESFTGVSLSSLLQQVK